MRKLPAVVGVVMMVVGSIWLLQGVDILPGSFMTGQIQWAVYGGVAVCVGLAIVLAAKRRGT